MRQLLGRRVRQKDSYGESDPYLRSRVAPDSVLTWLRASSTSPKYFYHKREVAQARFQKRPIDVMRRATTSQVGKIQRAEKLLHRRGFMPLIAIRFLPVPFTLVNAAAAVVGVKLPKFLLASAIGLLPPIAIITYFSATLLQAATGDRAGIVRQALAVSLTAALLVFFPIGLRRRLRKRRAKRLRAERAARPLRRGRVDR